MQEGVIQYDLEHTAEPLRECDHHAIQQLRGWRAILRDTALLGEDPNRYGGLGFGNMSHRVGAASMARGRRAFVVSGSQTSGIDDVGPDHFARVDAWSVTENRVVSRGPVPPSSEALTHATLYDHGAHLRCVLHVHSPDIWTAHRRLGVPATPMGVAYGTVAMANATASLLRSGQVFEVGAYVMLGHDDGVVAFGRSAHEAGTTLMRLLASALT